MIRTTTTIFLFLISLLTTGNAVFAQQYNVITRDEQQLIGNNIAYVATHDSSSIEEVVSKSAFTINKNKVLNFGLSDDYFWIKIPLVNQTGSKRISLNIDQPTLSYVKLYQSDKSGNFKLISSSGMRFPFSHREVHSPDYIYELEIPDGDSAICYVQLKGGTPLVVPIIAARKLRMQDFLNEKNSVFYIYLGIMSCMFFYNAFLMFSIKDDRSYIWYVVHTFLVALTQSDYMGYTFQYLWPNTPWLAQKSTYILTCMVSVAGIIFMQVFLQTRKNVPKLNRIFYVFFTVYGIVVLLALAGYHVTAFKLMQPTQMLVAIFILYTTGVMVRKGYKQARFYFLSWSLFMMAIIIFALRDLNLMPYNIFTATVLLTGSAVQVILLSFALADKINILQAATITMAKENLRIIEERNIELEIRVDERTYDLKVSNDELNITLDELKQAQSQLVESEKMASLGQLTAGIAHEINNPINFVTSNVSPLKRDVGMLLDAIETIEKIGLDDTISLEDKKKKINSFKEETDFDYLKMELDHLLKGINEGASRTAEIVKGLRIFSRVDEDDLKIADINEGVESTIVIINNLLGNIEVVKNYGDLPLAECYPGKLNQVFLNIITNAIHAIRSKFGDEPGGTLIITTLRKDSDILIKIADNGTGMTEATKKKIFEPFFTTKEVGEGTGLGMSIAYNTLRKHNGQILIESTLGEGTEFTMQFPIRQTNEII